MFDARHKTQQAEQSFAPRIEVPFGINPASDEETDDGPRRKNHRDRDDNPQVSEQRQIFIVISQLFKRFREVLLKAEVLITTEVIDERGFDDREAIILILLGAVKHSYVGDFTIF